MTGTDDGLLLGCFAGVIPEFLDSVFAKRILMVLQKSPTEDSPQGTEKAALILRIPGPVSEPNRVQVGVPFGSLLGPFLGCFLGSPQVRSDIRA